MTSTITLPRLAALALSVASLLIQAAPADARSVYKKGTTLRIEGQVVGPGGGAVPDATVVLRAEREARRLLGFGGDDRGPVSVPTTTDAQGNYGFDWSWDGYHDRFTLEVTLPAHGDRPARVLTRSEIDERLDGNNPVTVRLEVEEPSLIRFTSRLEAGELSDDERRVLSELGRPGRYVERDDDGGLVREWWFFERGRMYRFEAGGLGQVVHFDPVLPESDS